MDGPSAVDVLRARRVEVVDESGALRLVLGKLGEGDDAVYGVSVLAADPATGIHLTADASSAGLAAAMRGDGLLDMRVSGRQGEPSAAVDLGSPGGAAVTIAVARDGSIAVAVAGDVRLVSESSTAAGPDGDQSRL